MARSPQINRGIVQRMTRADKCGRRFLTQSYGIHAASRALRHADLPTTSEHCSDSTARVTPGIGG